VDALASAARCAGRPGGIWIAGLGYPTIGLGIAAGVLGSAATFGDTPQLFQAGLPSIARGMGRAISGLPQGALFLPLLFVVFRLQVGLARIAPPSIWNRLSETFGKPRLRQAWRAGKGLTWGSCGMWFMLTLMMAGVIGVLFAPIVLLIQALADSSNPELADLAWVLLLLPGLLILTLYGVLLSVLHQLALQSLTHNRRGVSSALVHAWRLAKNDPWSTARTVAVDVTLDITVWLISIVLALVSQVVPAGNVLFMLATLMLVGFTGVTRAGYWARAYRALGGLSPDDRVPGLQSDVPAEDAWSA
jgi:hypothetical protein